MTLGTLTLGVAALALGLFAWGMARWFTRPEGVPLRMRLLGLSASLAAVLHLASLALRPNGPIALVLACLGFAAAAALFLWALRAVGPERLAIAFSPSAPGRLVAEGPYRWVRHPIYSSYLLAWLSGILASTTVATVASALWMAAFYVAAAREEERLLARAHPASHAAFVAGRGCFLPRWPRIGRR